MIHSTEFNRVCATKSCANCGITFTDNVVYPVICPICHEKLKIEKIEIKRGKKK